MASQAVTLIVHFFSWQLRFLSTPFKSSGVQDRLHCVVALFRISTTLPFSEVHVVRGSSLNILHKMQVDYLLSMPEACNNLRECIHKQKSNSCGLMP